MDNSPRLELFDFADVDTAFSGLAFSAQNDHGSRPRTVPLENALNHVKNLGCQAIIKQHTVQDPDYFAEYYTYYSRMFADTPKYCHRFHFFSLQMNDGEDVLSFVDRAVDSDSYLGFITIRPVRTSPVGASILKPPIDHHFLLSSDRFPIHLAGRTFTVCGTPFMQQDNAVGACAQASIWMALRTLRKREGNSAFDPAQITSAATRFLVRGRTLPNREGLVVDQMIEVIRFAGYSPHIMKFGNPPLTGNDLQAAKRKIYTYVESEIPVVLGVYPSLNAGHAIVLIGHKWEKNNSPSPYYDRNNLKLYHAADWASCFIAHNDNTGPYLDLPNTHTTGYHLDQVVFAIPLLPSDVFMSGEEAAEVAQTILANLNLGAAHSNAPNPQPPNLVLRTYLTERNKFRSWAVASSGLHTTVKSHYRLKTIPKRVWITEINLLNSYNDACDGGLSRVGEILIDPTGDPDDAPFLSIHLNLSAITGFAGNIGVVIDREPDSFAIKVIPIPGDSLYSPLCR